MKEIQPKQTTQTPLRAGTAKTAAAPEQGLRKILDLLDVTDPNQIADLEEKATPEKAADSASKPAAPQEPDRPQIQASETLEKAFSDLSQVLKQNLEKSLEREAAPQNGSQETPAASQREALPEFYPQALKAWKRLETPPPPSAPRRGRPPKQLKPELETLVRRLEQNVGQAKKDRGDHERLYKERQRAIDFLFEEGRTLCLKGLYEEGLDAWRRLADLTGDRDELEESMAAIERLHEAERHLRHEAELMRQAALARPKTPSALSEALAEAAASLEEKIAEARRQKEADEGRVREKTETLELLIKEGRMFFSDGFYEGALDAWKHAAELADDRPVFDMLNRIAELDSDHRHIRDEIAALTHQSNRQFSISKEIRRILSDYEKAMEERIRLAREERGRAEKNVARRGDAVESLAREGHEQLVAGEAFEALGKWAELADVCGDEAMSSMIEGLREVCKQEVALQEALAKLRSEKKPPFPKPLQETLEDLKQKLEASAAQALKEKTQEEQFLAERQNAVDSIYEEGLRFYTDGRYEEALKTWKKLSVLTSEFAPIKELIESAEQFRVKAEYILKELERVRKSYATKPSVTETVRRQLESLSQSLQQKIQKERQDVAALEQSFAQRRQEIENLSIQTTEAFSEGRIGPGLAASVQLAQLTANQDLLRIAENAGQLYQQEIQIADQIQKLKSSEMQVPVEWVTALMEIERRLASRVETVRKEKEEKEAQQRQRSEALEKLLNEGRAHFAEGRSVEAFRVWRALCQQVEDAEGLRVLDSSERLHQERTKLEEEMRRLEKTSGLPSQIFQNFLDLQERFKQEVDASRSKLLETQKKVAERQQTLDRLYEEGQAFYKQGLLPEALSCWKRLADQVGDQDSLKKAIERTDEFRQNAEIVLKELERFKKNTDTHPKAPPQLEAELESLSSGLREKIKVIREDIAHEEKAVKQVRERIDTLFDEGRVHLSEGRFEEALQSWSGLVDLSEDPAMAVAIEHARRLILTERETQRELETLQKSLQARPKIPAGFKDAIGDLGQKLEGRLERVRGDRDAADRALLERRSAVERMIKNARIFSQNGDLALAVAEWEKLTEFLGDSKRLGPDIDSLKARLTEVQRLKEEVDASLRALEADPELGQEEISFFAQFRQSLNADVKEAATVLKQSRRLKMARSATLFRRLFIVAFAGFACFFALWFIQSRLQNDMKTRLDWSMPAYQNELKTVRAEHTRLLKQVSELEEGPKLRIRALEKDLDAIRQENKYLTGRVSVLQQDISIKDRIIAKFRTNAKQPSSSN